MSDDYVRAWNDLKTYLGKLPLLCAPVLGETLYIYLLISDQVVASALIMETGVRQQLVYFVSKVLHDAQTRYLDIEELAYA